MTERQYSLIKESWSMILTYISAMVLVFVLTFHLLLQSPLTGKTFSTGLQGTVNFGYATSNLTYYQVVFGLLLFAAILHGLNGLRVIALEWLHPQKRVWLLNLIVIVLMAFFLAMGSYTLLVVG